MGAGRTAVEDHLLVRVGVTQAAQLAGAEGLQPVAVALGHVPGRLDFVVQHRQHAPAGGLGRGGHPDAVQQVDVGVGAQRGGRPHGPGNHHRPPVLHRQVQEVGGLLQGRGAVGYGHPAGRGVPGENVVDAAGQLQPVGRQDVGAAHVDQLLRQYLGNFLRLGNIGQHLLDGQVAVAVAVVDVVGAKVADKGN